MKRRDFLKTSCTACIPASLMLSLLGSCKPAQIINGRINPNGLLVDLDDFRIKGSQNIIAYYPYIVVRNEKLKFPICIYRRSDKDFSAIWMQCAHQGAELQVAGAYLHCPAHGSEYNNKGEVTNGPADKDLKTFPVIINKNELFIDLRKS